MKNGQVEKTGCCVNCGQKWELKTPPGVRQTCPSCEAHLHSCVNCRLYNRRSDRCSSVTAECTGQRDHYNYCEEYQIAQIRLAPDPVQDDTKAKWRALFGE
jgi:hypothetical protein